MKYSLLLIKGITVLPKHRQSPETCQQIIEFIAIDWCWLCAFTSSE